MSSIAIQVEHLSKQYKIGVVQQGYETLRDSLIIGLKKVLHYKGRAHTGQDTFWALKDISFEVEQGEVLGLIGRNGAGKSTLLKILSRITKPTVGCAEIRGRVGSLLEVGTGFHAELTGREDIYLNGAILGMKRAEINRKLAEIVAFAEVEKFLDTPVKHYSSGMYLRLAFAVAAHLEPEILLVDEVLAVGDTTFQKKCLGKMGDIATQGRTVLCVSHSMAVISQLCPRTLWLDAGQIRMNGPTDEVLSSYLLDYSILEGQRLWADGICNPGVNELQVYSVCIRDSTGDVVTKLDIRKPFEIEIGYRIHKRLPFCRVGFSIHTVRGETVFETYDADDDRYTGPREPGTYAAKCMVPGNFLNAERYRISISAGMPYIKNFVSLDAILTFDIEDTGAVGSNMCQKRGGIIRPLLDWEVIPQ